jgi:hypothetical protein
VRSARIAAPFPDDFEDNIGFGVLMLFSPLFTLPLAIFGWCVGQGVSLKRAVSLAVIAVAIFTALSFAHVWNANNVVRERKKRSALNCTTMPCHCAVRDGKFDEIADIAENPTSIVCRRELS